MTINRGTQLLTGIVLLAVVIWGWVLPKLGKQKQVAAYSSWLEQRQIDPSAMFYTELESLSWSIPVENSKSDAE